MRITHIFIFAIFALLASGSVAATNYKPSTDGKALFENIHMASMCAKGFAVAVHFFGEEQFKMSQKNLVINMSKSACIEDSFVISLYNAQKNSPDAKTLDETRVVAEEMVANLVILNLEGLGKIKNEKHNQP